MSLPPIESGQIADSITGQRYQVIVTATPTVASPDGNYWIRMRIANGCGSVQQGNEEMGIIRYNSSSTATPSTAPNNDNFACQDEPPSKLQPVFQWNVTKIVNDRANFSFEAGIDSSITNSAFRWDLTDTPLVSIAAQRMLLLLTLHQFLNYSNPTLLNTQNDTYLNLPNNAVVRCEWAEAWLFLCLTDNETRCIR